MSMIAPSIETLNQYHQDKWLRVQQHDTLNLRIWNYSQNTELSKHWDDVTRQCRCYITDLAGKPIARTFRKFFNLGQEKQPDTETHDFVVQEKMDGSLGVLFYYHDANQWVFASRGSFVSPQAERGRQMLAEKYCSYDHVLDKSISYVFEIVYETNRIVVDYGDLEALVYLSSFRPDGTELFRDERVLNLVRSCGFPIVKVYESVADYNTLCDLYKDDKNREGFVVRFNNSGERIKVKLEYYFKSHRIRSNLSITSVWKWFRDDDQANRALMPSDFASWVESIWNEYQREFDRVLTEAETTYKQIYEQTCRLVSDPIHSPKWVAEFAKITLQTNSPYRSFIFSKRQNKPYRHILCEFFKPIAEDAFTKNQSKHQEEEEEKEQDVYDFQNVPGRVLLILRGPSGVGKSTWAKNYVATRQDNRAVIISRDGLRLMCYGNNSQDFYKDDRRLERENNITSMILNLVRGLFSEHHDKIVILDGTNLLAKHIKVFLDTFQSFVTIRFKIFDNVSLKTALLNDTNRSDGRMSGEKVITRHFEQFSTNLRTMRELETRMFIKQQTTTTTTTSSSSRVIQNRKWSVEGVLKPECFIVDLDGTLCEKGTRNPFDYSRVILDTAREAVRSTVLALHKSGFNIVICSGRDDSCQRDTIMWLHQEGIVYQQLYMRKTGDVRPDYVIKEEMWRKICVSYFIVAMFDDRDQVVNHARACGFDCFQVQPGSF